MGEQLTNCGAQSRSFIISPINRRHNPPLPVSHTSLPFVFLPQVTILHFRPPPFHNQPQAHDRINLISFLTMEPQVSTPISLPLLNSIPPTLVPKFESTYIEYYNKYSAGRLATHQIPIETYRSNPAAYTVSYGRALVSSSGLKITTETLNVSSPPGTIKIGVFEPEEKGEGKRPVYVNFHGGGWVFGGLATDLDFCKRIAKDTGAVVFDVDYRLAPEERFPTQVEDCWEALLWVCIFSPSSFA